MLSPHTEHTDTQKTKKFPPRHLHHLGWSPFFQEQWKDSDLASSPARIVGVRKNAFIVDQGRGQLLATLAGKLQKTFATFHPVVGDWVLLNDSLINAILQRKNVLSRVAPGRKNRHTGGGPPRDQLIAANLSRTFIVCGLDRDFNLRRIERYLTLVYNCGITPEIILTKADLHQHPRRYVDAVGSVAMGVPVHLLSLADEDAIGRLQHRIAEGETVALIGSSGAGKSTLINALYGKPIQATGAVSRRLGKGTHTTTHRDLIVLPTGGMVIDNPGIREVAVGAGWAGSASAFADIDQLSLLCRFQDCSHSHEPGCQVLQAVSNGLLSPKRLENYRKIEAERTYIAEREQKSGARVERERWKDVALHIKAMKKRRQR